MIQRSVYVCTDKAHKIPFTLDVKALAKSIWFKMAGEIKEVIKKNLFYKCFWGRHLFQYSMKYSKFQENKDFRTTGSFKGK